MSSDLRQLYENLKSVQQQEQTIRKQLTELTEARNQIRVRIERFMESSNVQVINVSGTADSMEMVEERKYDTQSKEVMIKKIVDFFHTIGGTEEYRAMLPSQQAQMLVQKLFVERSFQVVRRLKVKTNRAAKRAQEVVEESARTYAPPPSSSSAAGAGGGEGRPRLARRK